MPEVLPEDRTTPQRPPAPPPDPSLARGRAESRPSLDVNRDATIVLPRGSGAGDASRTAPSTPVRVLKPGVRMHEYRIDGVLGEGGFGTTYLATDEQLNAAVAIKEHLPQDIVSRSTDGTVSPTASEHMPRYKHGLDRFLVEARTLASFRHRAIVRVSRFFEAHHIAHMVLEVESGEPLKSWWPLNKQIGQKALIELLLPLLDFGGAGQTAGVTSHGLVVVTPGYAPIEQYGLGEQGPWTGLYALGATLYWAVAGKKPPDAETRKVDAKAYTRAVEAGRNVYGDAFLRAIDWALDADPAKRPRSVADFRRALRADYPGSVQRFDAAQQCAQARARADESAHAERQAPARPRR